MGHYRWQLSARVATMATLVIATIVVVTIVIATIARETLPAAASARAFRAIDAGGIACPHAPPVGATKPVERRRGHALAPFAIAPA